MNYEDKKIVAILSSSVDMVTALNVIGHLAISIGKYSDVSIMGQKIILDKSQQKHLGISRFPFIVTKVKPGKLKAAIQKAKQNPKLLVVDYPKEMLETRDDSELVSAVSEKYEEELEYFGAIFYGDTIDVDAITGHFQLWRVD